MTHGLVGILAQELPQPPNPVTAHGMIQTGVFRQLWKVGKVSAYHNRRVGLMLTDEFTHPPYLEEVGHDRADADDVVLVGFELFKEPLLRGEIKQRAGGLDIDLHQHQTPRAVEGS